MAGAFSREDRRMSILTKIFGTKQGGIKSAKSKKPGGGRATARSSLGNQVSLEEMSKEKVCELLTIYDVRGPMVSVIRCRKLMCDWVGRLGEKGVVQKRSFMIHQFKQVEGIRVVEDLEE